MSHDTDNKETEGCSIVGFPDLKSLEAKAAEWLAKLDADNPSNEDLEAFRRWINKDKAHYQAFESMIDFWEDLNVLTQVVSPREENRQHRSVKSNPYSMRNGIGVVMSGLCAFAMIIACVVLAPHLITPSPSVYLTEIGEQKIIELPDHTMVFLNTNSRLEVNYGQQKRRVSLVHGEAHFDVFHNPDVPFEVYAGERLVRALGTAFTVHVRKVDVEVVVTEGIVEIDTQKPVVRNVTFIEENASSNQAEESRSASDSSVSTPVFAGGIQVKAGSSAVYSDEALGEIKLMLAEKIEEKLSWRQGILIFKGEPLESVVSEISRYTPLEIIIPEKRVRELKVGGLFKVGDTESLFEALREGFGIHATKTVDDQIYLVVNESQK